MKNAAEYNSIGSVWLDSRQKYTQKQFFSVECALHKLHKAEKTYKTGAKFFK